LRILERLDEREAKRPAIKRGAGGKKGAQAAYVALVCGLGKWGKGVMVTHGIDVRTGGDEGLDNQSSILERGGVKKRPSAWLRSEVGIALGHQVLEYWSVLALVERLVQAVEQSLIH
jgi:hypothetical protein